MKKFLAFGAAAVALAGLAPAIAQTAQPGAQAQPAQRVATVHSRAEVQAKVAQHFARVDANRDGFVTRPEADAAAQTMRARIQQRIGQRGGRMFERLDSNRDGQVSRAEAEAARAARQAQVADRRVDRTQRMFERLDSNRDGAISRAEFDAGRAQRSARREQRPDGADRGPGGHHMRMIGGRMFETADANSDGRVSLQEAQDAALRHFDMADSNRDGQVTPDERRQMRQRMRDERRPG